jgi:(p)ppGpp synthase/HD superfamily hydrolase
LTDDVCFSLGMPEVLDPATDRRESEPFTPAAADALAARLLGDLRTKLGGLHIEHARRVAERVRPTGDDRTVAVALLHDVVEKGQSPLADLLAVVRDERVVHLVDILTRRGGESEEEYLSRCAADPVALAIKRADLADKHFHGDAQVDQETAQRLGQEAQERLELLDLLARVRGGATSALGLAKTSTRPRVMRTRLGNRRLTMEHSRGIDG